MTDHRTNRFFYSILNVEGCRKLSQKLQPPPTWRCNWYSCGRMQSFEYRIALLTRHCQYTPLLKSVYLSCPGNKRDEEIYRKNSINIMGVQNSNIQKIYLLFCWRTKSPAVVLRESFFFFFFKGKNIKIFCCRLYHFDLLLRCLKHQAHEQGFQISRQPLISTRGILSSLILRGRTCRSAREL